ncbi:hypothetical protein E5P63_00985 [Helicobacter pylori]|uniref:coiled-coil domain-containing protein n=1 Tax=Helicobacter pylori TaxID=210 RepID=UPI000D3BEA74|nr:hypothetical protein [Helicobacter pylori]PUD28412.1 hypothetical protein C2S29_00955 [Helicobacter pylori]WQX29273.1 hypothetical protein E5P63_00985 [Helicobacter pylori]
MEQVYSSLEGIYQISKVLNQLDLLKNFSDHDLEVISKIEAMKNALAGYEKSEQELKEQINAVVTGLEAKKQELEARLNMQLQSALNGEVKNNLVAELTEAKNKFLKFLGIYVYGHQTFFENKTDEFRELFEFDSIHISANKSYIVQFSMPYELSTDGLYSQSMGEMVLCLKANNNVYPIINSFYQNKSSNLNFQNKIIDTYSVNCVFKTPSDEADYRIAVFARKHKDLWVNVNYTSNTEGFETSFLNRAQFANLTTQSIPTDYSNDWVFYKHSKALVYEIL